jgi:hypothetical protein
VLSQLSYAPTLRYQAQRPNFATVWVQFPEGLAHRDGTPDEKVHYGQPIFHRNRIGKRLTWLEDEFGQAATTTVEAMFAAIAPSPLVWERRRAKFRIRSHNLLPHWEWDVGSNGKTPSTGTSRDPELRHQRKFRSCIGRNSEKG